MALRIELLPEAENELDRATGEYAGIGDPVRSFSDETNRVFTQISRFPLSGPVFGPIRRCLYHGYPYAVIYRVLSNHISVVAVMHTTQRPGYWRCRVTKK